jgi:signal transduction histidine kinase
MRRMEGPWLFGTVALLLVGAAGFLVGLWRERAAGEAAARAARQEARLSAQLLDGWAWQTDAAHRLQRWQSPAGQGAAEAVDSSQPMWALFEAVDVQDLRARLESQQPLADLRVVRRADGSRWKLRAAPRLDDAGRFAGHAGSAQPTAEADALAADQGALVALLDALDRPAMLAVDEGANGWQLRHANAAARERFGDAQRGELLPRLPAGLRDAVAAGSATEHEGWRLQRYATPSGAGLLLLGPAAPVPADDAGESASFSFTVSHDLRAPIRVVDGFTRIVKEDYGQLLDRVANDHLDRVLGAAARMNHMIDALLTLARLSQQPLAWQPVNLSLLAAFVVDDLRRGAPERAAQIEIEPDLHARGDPTLLRLVLENLLGNAWKYSARAKTAHIVFGSEQRDGRRVFVVRDNGAGFDMRSADRLFGLFQRLHSASDFPGTGVGLASVKRIVRRHGGEVWADAEPGRGAAFHFTLRD